MRGKECIVLATLKSQRITPACAGKSPFIPLPCILNEDHPRVCGEKIFNFKFFILFKGSPPRVRGKGLNAYRRELYLRITPACAGKRRDFLPFLVDIEDHPRVCGEKLSLKSVCLLLLGSPPRVRGKGFTML